MKHLRRKLCLLAGSFLLSCTLWGQSIPADSLTQTPEAWYIHFKRGISNLELNYNGNDISLQQCINRVHEILDKKEYTIDHVRITGFASPEGPLSLNQRLSAERAESLKAYLISKSGLPEEMFEVVAGGENWDELRVLVEKSDIKEKENVLDIIKNTPEGVDPEIALKKLPNNTYRYLLNTFYPKLRSASSVQVLKSIPVVVVPVIKKEVQIVEIDTVKPAPQKPVIAEPVPCGCEPPFLAIKTNLAYWATVITPNIEIEAFFAKQYSVSVEGVYRWLHDPKAKGINFHVAYISPEIRRYMRNDETYQGAYWGVYGLYGEYDIKLGSTGRQGNTKGLGISYGYIFKFNRFDCLYFDLGISAGYSRLSYDKYSWYDPCNPYVQHRGRNYWGPTKLKASLVWRF